MCSENLVFWEELIGYFVIFQDDDVDLDASMNQTSTQEVSS